MAAGPNPALRMYQLQSLTLKEMTECGAALRRLGTAADSMEATADRIVRFFHDSFRTRGGDGPGTVLVRFYKTHRFDRLEPGLQSYVRDVLGDQRPAPSLRCLTLLATAGELPAWNSRHESVGHRAIPLANAAAIERLPMISRLVDQLGVGSERLLDPEPKLMLDLEQHTFNIFHVEDAADSPYIPAQADFVRPFGVRSVLGFGGVLPSGDLFATILFTRVHVPPNTAQLFKPLALAAKVALLPFVSGPTFDPAAPLSPAPDQA